MLVLVGVPPFHNIPGIVGQLMSMLGVLVVAVLVLVVRRWRGWRRFSPLIMLLAIPVGAALVEITTLDGVFVVLYATASLLLGYAVASTTATSMSPTMRARVRNSAHDRLVTWCFTRRRL